MDGEVSEEELEETFVVDLCDVGGVCDILCEEVFVVFCEEELGRGV